MNEPVWLYPETVIAIHEEQVTTFGGPLGLRDRGMLESALSRPQNKFAYGETDLAMLAASYAYGIARNHPFVDGNKRTAFQTLLVFLALNGFSLDVDTTEATAIILELAEGNVGEEGLSRWIRDNWPH